MSEYSVRCGICGREFQEGEEYFRLEKAKLLRSSPVGNMAQVVEEKIMCVHECGEMEVVKL